MKQSLIDADVEVSDDFFILKADDARKLQEPPRLVELLIKPDQVMLRPGHQVSFICSAIDQYGQSFPIPKITWSAAGGTITADGLFTAGTTSGQYTVRTEAAGYEAIAEVRIHEDKELPPPPPGKRVLSWTGRVPTQKWMNFYTKVLTRFAALDLELKVSFKVPLDREQAQAKGDETRSGLKELGLDDDVAVT